MAQDFKPANCMLCSNGLIKITDFGAWSILVVSKAF